MSDNNLNSDSKEPLHNSTLQNTGNEETQKKHSESEDKPEKPDVPGKKEDESPDEILDEKKEKAPVDTESSKNENEIITPSRESHIKPKPKDSNYQISLINENLLKVLVTSKKGIKIYSTVKENKSLSESQSNEVYFNPKIDYSLQEIEILISIEDDSEIKEQGDISENEEKDTPKEINPRSNYQINLINENLLKVKIITGFGVKIDSVARDKRYLSQTQSNKIYLKKRHENELQEIEITVAIDEETKELKTLTDDGKIKLIPNPDVVDLIKPPDYSSLLQDEPAYLDEGSAYKNPFDALRKLIRKNLTIGLIAAVVLHLAAIGFAYVTLTKKSQGQNSEEPSRLIVLQDLPDPKIKLEDVEDPNKPKVEPPVIAEEPPREIIPRDVVKPPRVSRPKREPVEEDETPLDSAMDTNLTRELDSLREWREKYLADSLLGLSDTTNSDTALSAYEIPDSLRNNFNENDIGLAMYFPKNWKLTDQREINKNEKEFKGVVLTDTTAEQPGTMTMFIFLDSANKDYSAEDFKTEFAMVDSNLTAFLKEPKTLAGFTEYRFYIFNNVGTEKLSLRASVRKQFFDQYKNEIEAVVRSIRIKKIEDIQ